MTTPTGERGLRYLELILGVFLTFLVYLKGIDVLPGFVVISVFLVFFYRLARKGGSSGVALKSIAYALLGILYIPLLFSYLMLVRGFQDGQWWLLLMFTVVYGNDTFAYYIGRNLGRHKFSPIVSPNKTIEGSLGGLAGGMLVALVMHYLFLGNLIGVRDILLLAFFLGILGQLGDLFESLIKRSVGVKDSGFVIPGHGGMLDRIDSIIFPLPFLYYYIIMVV